MEAEAIARRLWPESRPQVEVLGGGITNRNFKISVDEGTFVLRIGGKDTDLLGHRPATTSTRPRVVAAGLGVGPEVVRFVEPEGYLVTRFVEGAPVPVDELRRPERLRDFARTLRRVHDGPAIGARFDSFRVVESYCATAVARSVAVPAAYEEAKRIANEIERVRGPQPLRTCHNDLLNANLIATAAGIVIVDWEYAGMGDRFFDLANFAANHELGDDESRELLDAYFGELRAEDEDALRLMRFMSDFREAMWGVVQQGISELDFDFAGYADEHFERLARTAAEPAFQAALRRVKERAQVVVVGGGVGGCAILYWLARLGCADAVLVERADLTSGSTFHSAGLVGQLRGSISLTKMMMSSVELYRTLGAEVELETGWREVGSLRLASSEERMEEIARQAGWAKTFGLPLELVSPAEAQELFPPMSTDGVLGAAYIPTDGYIDPSQLTFALAEGARRHGAEIATGTRVTGVRVERGRVTGVETDRGPIETEIVVNAGGMFAGEIGRLAGVNVPVVPMAHEYLITVPADLPLEMPTMRDPSLLVYFRPESGGLVVGGYERDPAPWSLDGIPADFNGQLLEEDWPRFEPLLENAIRRVPVARGDGRGPAHQRPGGLHARRRVHPRADRRARLLGRRRLLRARARRRRRNGEARRRVDPRGDARASTSGTWTRAASAPPTAAASTRSRARSRSTRRTTTSSTRATSGRPGGRCASPRPTSGCASSAPPSARSRAGSARTGSSRTPRAATSRCGRAGGRGSCGRRRSARSTSPAARRRRSSTRRRSRRSRSRARALPSCSSTSATTASRATSARSPTRRC